MAVAALPSRVCNRGHVVVEGTTGIRRADGHLRCRVCRRLNDVQYRAGSKPAPINSANPWAGRQPCPSCDSEEWTMPIAPDVSEWRCVSCHLTFVPGEGS